MKKAIVWVTVMVLVGKMLFAMANISQGMLLSDFISAFALEKAWQGVPNAAANAGSFTAMLLALPLAARIGKQWLFASALGLITLMMLIVGTAQAAPVFIIAYGVMGLSFGALDTTASSIIADLHAGKRASMMMGMLHAAYGTGGILVPLLMTAARDQGATWRTILLGLCAILGLAGVACVMVFRRAGGETFKAAAGSGKLTAEGLKRFFKKPGNLMIVLVAACYCAHQVSIYIWIERVINEGYGAKSLAALALALFWVGTVASRLSVPLLPMRAVAYVKYSMALVTVLLLACGAIGGAVPAVIGTAAAGLLGGATLPMLLSEITRRNPGQSMLSVTAVLLTTGLAAIVTGPLIATVVGLTSLSAVLFISGAFALLCTSSAFFVKNASIKS